MCVLVESIVGRTGNIVEVRSSGITCEVCVAEINGINRHDSIDILRKEHKHLHLYFFPSD